MCSICGDQGTTVATDALPEWDAAPQLARHPCACHEPGHALDPFRPTLRGSEEGRTQCARRASVRARGRAGGRASERGRGAARRRGYTYTYVCIYVYVGLDPALESLWRPAEKHSS